MANREFTVMEVKKDFKKGEVCFLCRDFDEERLNPCSQDKKFRPRIYPVSYDLYDGRDFTFLKSTLVNKTDKFESLEQAIDDFAALGICNLQSFPVFYSKESKSWRFWY